LHEEEIDVLPFSYETDTRPRSISEMTYYVEDYLGNTRVVYTIDMLQGCGDNLNQPVITSALDYYPYGKILREYHAGQIEKYQTTQHERDLETGLDYRGARFYDSDVARFLSLDPLAADFVSWSAYNYVLSNPVRFIDPDGKAPTDPPKIISRSEWGAREPVQHMGRSYDKIEGSLNDYYDTVVIHHTGNDDSYPTMNDVQDQHIDDKKKADIGYHFGIDKDGNIFEGRSLDIKGAHVNKANTGKIGVVLLGDFDTKDSGLPFYKGIFEVSDDEMTDAMREALSVLVAHLVEEYEIDTVGGHNEVNCERHCPGDLGEEEVERVRKETGTDPPIGVTGND